MRGYGVWSKHLHVTCMIAVSKPCRHQPYLSPPPCSSSPLMSPCRHKSLDSFHLQTLRGMLRFLPDGHHPVAVRRSHLHLVTPVLQESNQLGVGTHADSATSFLSSPATRPTSLLAHLPQSPWQHLSGPQRQSATVFACLPDGLHAFMQESGRGRNGRCGCHDCRFSKHHLDHRRRNPYPSLPGGRPRVVHIAGA